jgi:hypothetical protein
MFDRTIKSGTALLENAIEAICAILAQEQWVLGRVVDAQRSKIKEHAWLATD